MGAEASPGELIGRADPSGRRSRTRSPPQRGVPVPSSEGEPGIGESRLLAFLAAKRRGGGQRRARGPGPPSSRPTCPSALFTEALDRRLCGAGPAGGRPPGPARPGRARVGAAGAPGGEPAVRGPPPRAPRAARPARAPRGRPAARALPRRRALGRPCVARRAGGAGAPAPGGARAARPRGAHGTGATPAGLAALAGGAARRPRRPRCRWARCPRPRRPRSWARAAARRVRRRGRQPVLPRAARPSARAGGRAARPTAIRGPPLHRHLAATSRRLTGAPLHRHLAATSRRRTGAPHSRHTGVPLERRMAATSPPTTRRCRASGGRGARRGARRAEARRRARLLDGAAVAGDPFELGLAAAVAELPERAALEALPPAPAGAPRAGRRRPRGAAPRSVIRSCATRSTSRSVAAGGSAPTRARPPRCAEQGAAPLVQARAPRRALGRPGGRGGGRAARRGRRGALQAPAPATAARFYAAALRLLPDSPREPRSAAAALRLADAQAAGGDPAGARRTLLEAAQRAQAGRSRR